MADDMKYLGDMSEQRLLIFGGCYSNLAATRAMQTVSRELGLQPRQIMCTGDLIAYCAEPAEVIDLIQDWGIHVLMGNCEESLGFQQVDCGCGFEQTSVCSTLAVAWYQYASKRISAAHRGWMQSLPRIIEFEFQSSRFRLVHGSVTSINQFVFPSSDAQMKLAQINQAGVDVVIGGHSGIPFGQTLIDDNSRNKLWLNSGVIGMPANDGTADGWYMLIEAENAGYRVRWERLNYDAAVSQATTREAGMVEYAEALTSGLWPSMDILPAAEQVRQGQRLDLKPLTVANSD